MNAALVKISWSGKAQIGLYMIGIEALRTQKHTITCILYSNTLTLCLTTLLTPSIGNK